MVCSKTRYLRGVSKGIKPKPQTDKQGSRSSPRVWITVSHTQSLYESSSSARSDPVLAASLRPAGAARHWALTWCDLEDPVEMQTLASALA